jgi:hypothetical protein
VDVEAVLARRETGQLAGHLDALAGALESNDAFDLVPVGRL